MSAADLKSLLLQLKTEDPKRTIFGSRGHDYAMHPASPESVDAFEARWGVRLPSEFRRFVLEVTDGGAGPGYGLFPLERAPGADAKEHPTLLAQPFDEAFFSEEEPDHEDYDNDDEYDEALHVFWRDLPGTIMLCEYGCGIRGELIISGPLAGQVLLDYRCDRLPIAFFTQATNIHRRVPRRGPGDDEPLSFSQWYFDWLEISLAELQGGDPDTIQPTPPGKETSR
jgi:hypothetical protein